MSWRARHDWKVAVAVAVRAGAVHGRPRPVSSGSRAQRGQRRARALREPSRSAARGAAAQAARFQGTSPGRARADPPELEPVASTAPGRETTREREHAAVCATVSRGETEFAKAVSGVPLTKPRTASRSANEDARLPPVQS